MWKIMYREYGNKKNQKKKKIQVQDHGQLCSNVV